MATFVGMGVVPIVASTQPLLRLVITVTGVVLLMKNLTGIR